MTQKRIIFDSVWKKFHRGERHDSLRDLIPATIRKLTGRRSEQQRELQTGDFWAVKDLSFEVNPGQTLGIIGPNGSGKSTTLKLLTRIYEPSRGHCTIHGRIGALIEISAGFHGDLTGRENVFLQGAIMGMRSADITRRFDEIVEFSGIAAFIDTPVKRYSSGMNARLGFSIAAHLEPDVLIIDEVLAVGDMQFQERAFGRIRELANSGLPVVMVSHQLDRIAELCTDVIVLRAGEVAARGTPDDAVAAYVKSYDSDAQGMLESDEVALDSLQTSGESVRSGEHVVVRMEGRVLKKLEPHIEPLGLMVRSLRSGKMVYLTGSRRLDADCTPVGTFRVEISLQANLPAGEYTLETFAYDTVTMQRVAAGPYSLLRVIDPNSFRGTNQLNATMRVLEPSSREGAFVA